MIHTFLLGVLLFQMPTWTGCTNSCYRDSCRESTMAFTSLLCTDPKANAVLNGITLKKTQQPFESRCAFLCHQDMFCQGAIYKWLVYPSCTLISAMGSPTEKPQGRLADCRALVLRKPIRCFKCGQPREFSCSCPETHYGQHCEMVKPDSCLTSSWVNVTRSVEATQFLERAHEDVKALLVNPCTTGQSHCPVASIYRISSLRTINETLLALANGFLEVDFMFRQFKVPVSLEFKLFINASGVRTYTVALDGTSLQTSYKDDQSIEILTREEFENTPQTYDIYFYTGSPYDVTSGLADGYRLLSRVPTRVGYDQSQGEAFLEFLTTRMGIGDNFALATPLYFNASKQTMYSERVFRAHYVVGQGSGTFLEPTWDYKLWQLDGCWYPLRAGQLGQTTVKNMLREAVLNGHEIRVLMNLTASSDVVEVVLTEKDFAVSLASFLTPFDSENDFSENSTLTYSVISDSNTISTCQAGFHGAGSTRSSIDSHKYNDPLTWVLGIRSWTLVLRMDFDLVVHNGTKESLASYSERGYDVRVCVEYSQGLTICHGADVVHLMPHNHTLIQTVPAVDLDFYSNGTFFGIADSPAGCLLHHSLISTEGWIRSTRYSVGQPPLEESILNVDFDFLSWFVSL